MFMLYIYFDYTILFYDALNSPEEKITNSEKLSMNGSEKYVQAGLSEHFDLKHPCSVFTDSISDESKCHDSLLNCEKINLNQSRHWLD